MRLAVRSPSKHFVPSVETARITYVPPPLKKVDALTIEITDRADQLVYRQVWDNQPIPSPFIWDGENNQAAAIPTVAKQFVNPLGSPYKAKLTAQLSNKAPVLSPPPGISLDEGLLLPCGKPKEPPDPKEEPLEDPPVTAVGETTVKVLYHSVKLRRMTWLEVYRAVTGRADGSFPVGGSDDEQKTWLQYQLNELGYPAGPIEELPRDAPLERALYHYTQAHPNLPHIHEFATDMVAGGGTDWGWKALWEAEFGTLDALCTGAATVSGLALLAALRNAEGRRADPIETADALNDITKHTRAILDHDIYYLNKDFSHPDAHAEYDLQFMNPLTLPFRVEVLLTSQTDATGTAAGVSAPAAVGPVPIEWSVFDPPEDLSVVPTPVTGGGLRSQSRRFLQQTREDVAIDATDPLDPQDNCPRARGGARGSYNDMDVYFEAVDELGAHTLVGDLRRFVTTANDDLTDPRQQLGMSAVWFKGSHVAGDNFCVQARLYLDESAGGPALKSDHQALPGLAQCFAPRKRRVRDDPPDPLVAQTGTITVWRRNRVLREVIWGPDELPPIDWMPVVDNFRAAHIILVLPTDPPIAAADLFDALTRKALAEAIVDSAAVNEPALQFPARRGLAECRRDGMFPLPYLTLDQFEASALHVPPRGASSAERFSKYCDYLTKLNAAWPNYDSLVDLTLALREAFDGLRKGPGLIIVRTRFMPIPDFAALLPQRVFAATKEARAAFVFKRAIATGMDYGVVCLDVNNGQRFSDGFFVSHEIGHCLFGSHAHEPSSKLDHDTSDLNCIMYYNSNNGGLATGWAVRTQPERYTLELELRGAPPANSYGSVSGGFRKKSEKEYEFTGTLQEVQAVVRAAKFSPARDLSPGGTVKLTLRARGVAPRLSVGALPLVTTVKADSAAIKPYAQLTLQHVDLRANQPRFCGKCLLKLRGWRVRPVGGHEPDLPEVSLIVPVNPVMTFEGYKILDGTYFSEASGVMTAVSLREGAKDPLNTNIPLGPYAFLHVHKLTWESSNGKLEMLAGVRTREYVRFRGATQDPPFCDYADPDQEFTQNGDYADSGEAIDEHSMNLASLICAWPLQAGGVIGEQWYQYSHDGRVWHNIEGAAFLLEKRVYHTPAGWVLMFKKSNWAPHNTVPFSFEVHYRIGPQPLSTPKIVANPHAVALGGHPAVVGGSVILLAGPRTAMRSKGAAKAVTLEYLEQAGYLAPKPWL